MASPTRSCAISARRATRIRWRAAATRSSSSTGSRRSPAGSRKRSGRAGITPLLGATLHGVEREGRRIRSLGLATRYGDVTAAAPAFVDASGDAALAWFAGLETHEPEI